MFYVYIVKCSDGTLYTGSTTNVPRRIRTHNAGKGAKYTRSRLPVSLVYQEEVESWSAALRREAAIKRQPRAKKIALIRRAEPEESSPPQQTELDPKTC
ncbi:MAG: GIY-YIG nuclease family protein [Clostridiales bacterium]|nr:GIY-YIG nuclease family protein [Clostridiales bacterium]